jgi:hypothetical protein
VAFFVNVEIRSSVGSLVGSLSRCNLLVSIKESTSECTDLRLCSRRRSILLLYLWLGLDLKTNALSVNDSPPER